MLKPAWQFVMLMHGIILFTFLNIAQCTETEITIEAAFQGKPLAPVNSQFWIEESLQPTQNNRQEETTATRATECTRSPSTARWRKDLARITADILWVLYTSI